MALTPRQHLVLYRALQQVVEELVAGDLILARDLYSILQLADIEVADPEVADLARLPQFFERAERLLERFPGAGGLGFEPR